MVILTVVLVEMVMVLVMAMGGIGDYCGEGCDDDASGDNGDKPLMPDVLRPDPGASLITPQVSLRVTPLPDLVQQQVGAVCVSYWIPVTFLLCSCYRQSCPALPGIPKDPNPGCERQSPRTGHSL